MRENCYKEGVLIGALPGPVEGERGVAEMPGLDEGIRCLT